MVTARSTASPRRTCVPGVHAHAASGSSVSNTTAPTSARTAVLEAELLALPPDRPAQVVELGLDEIIDGLARGLEIVAHFFLDLVARDAVPRVDALVPREARTTAGHLGTHASAFAGHAP